MPGAATNGDHKTATTSDPPPVMTSALPQLPKLEDIPKPAEGDKAVAPEEHVNDDFVRDVVGGNVPSTAEVPAEKPIEKPIEKPTEQATESAPPEEAPLVPSSTPAVTNGASTAKDVEMKDAPPPAVSTAAPAAGDKRKAEGTAPESAPVADAGPTPSNGASALVDDEPAAKKAKTDAPTNSTEDAAGEAMPPPSTQPTAPAEAKTNGGVKRGNSRAKKDKKPIAPVGRTERRTRSQGHHNE